MLRDVEGAMATQLGVEYCTVLHKQLVANPKYTQRSDVPTFQGALRVLAGTLTLCVDEHAAFMKAARYNFCRSALLLLVCVGYQCRVAIR